MAREFVDGTGELLGLVRWCGFGAGTTARDTVVRWCEVVGADDGHECRARSRRRRRRSKAAR